MMLLPRDAVSWSMRNAFRTSYSQFVKRYYEGEELFKTKELRFGSWFAEVMEERDYFSLDEKTVDVISQIKLLDTPEYKFACEIRGIPCLGYADGAASDLSKINEFKTGKTPWNKSSVNGHGQLAMYAAMAHEISGNIPELFLYWCQTKNGKGRNEIVFTGKVECFRRTFTIDEIEQTKDQIRVDAEEISADFKRWLDGYDFDEKTFNEYIETLREIEVLTARSEDLKMKIEDSMKKVKLRNFRHSGGTFYFSKKRTYLYDNAELKEMIKEYKDLAKKIKEKQAEEQPKSKYREVEVFNFRKSSSK